MCCIVPNKTISLVSNQTTMNNFNFLLFIFFCLVAAPVLAQNKKDDTLYTQIAHMDSVLFNAFNNRDTVTFNKLFTKDLEFYHDKGGLTGYGETIEFMRSTAHNPNGLKRDLVSGSLEVYPVPGYGAMEIGSHRFCHTENGKLDCGTFQFVHIWKRIGNEWKITRVVSYGH
jgi:hypothetical protein